jgi:hypothetical protein
MSEKARVFISCGQRKNTGELTIVKQIADNLDKIGFEPYIAVEEQRLEGVKENIFKRLENAEYFLFVDFKRERLPSGEHRGSLFSHQELAIATFRGYEVLAFQEEGVKKEDGILRYIQANCYPFSKRQELPSVVAQKVQERKWNPNWKNELALERDNNEYEEVQTTKIGEFRRFYHIEVVNHHKDRIARSCVAYVENIKNLANGKTRTPEFVELKWKGMRTASVSIAPKSVRKLDAFYINHNKQSTANLRFNKFIVDWIGYYQEYAITGSGDYEIDYVVFSENFSSARAKLRLHIGAKLDDVVFKKIQFAASSRA